MKEKSRDEEAESNGGREELQARLGHRWPLTRGPEATAPADAHLPAQLPRMRLPGAGSEHRTCWIEPSVSVYFSSVCWISRKQQHRLSYSVILG